MSHDTTAVQATHDDHEDHGQSHIVSYGTLFGVGFALLLMTIVTVAVRYVDAGELNMPIALGIAGVKATLVALYFMHLRWDRPFNALVLVGSIAFVVLLMVFLLMDSAQYAPQIFKGNAPSVQEVLTVEAPGAPIAEQSQLP